MRIRLMMFVWATASLFPPSFWLDFCESDTQQHKTHNSLPSDVNRLSSSSVRVFFFAFLLSSLTVTRVWATLRFCTNALTLPLQLVFTVWWLRGLGLSGRKEKREKLEERRLVLSVCKRRGDVSLLLTFAFLLLVKSLHFNFYTSSTHNKKDSSYASNCPLLLHQHLLFLFVVVCFVSSSHLPFDLLFSFPLMT